MTDPFFYARTLCSWFVCVFVCVCALFCLDGEWYPAIYFPPWHRSLEPSESRPMGRKGVHWGSSGSVSLHNGTVYPPVGCSRVSTAPILPGVKKNFIKNSDGPGDGAVGAVLSKDDLSLYPFIRLICSSLEKLHLDTDIEAGRSAYGRSLWTNELWEDLSQDAICTVWLALHTDKESLIVNLIVSLLLSRDMSVF